MKRAMGVVLAALAAAPLMAAEVVVFESGRSLVVQGHRRDGEWIRLRVGTGEIAVRAESVLRIAEEGAAAAESSAVLESPQETAETAVEAPPPPGRKREPPPAEGGLSQAAPSSRDPKRPAESSLSAGGSVGGAGGAGNRRLSRRGASYAPLGLQGGDLRGGAVAQRRQPLAARPTPQPAPPTGE